MEGLTKNHLDQLMVAIQDLCDAVGNQASAAVKTRVTDLKTDLGNYDEPRPDEGG
jgi:hypothetical protein